MDNIETLEMNVDNIIDESIVDSSTVDAPINAKKVMPVSEYSEIELGEKISYNEPTQNSSSILPLCITIIVCLALGIVLGILAAKKTANK